MLNAQIIVDSTCLIFTGLLQNQIFVLLEHFSNTFFSWDGFLNIHPAPVSHQRSHLINFIIQPKKPTSVYEQYLLSLPTFGILCHLIYQTVRSFPTK